MRTSIALKSIILVAGLLSAPLMTFISTSEPALAKRSVRLTATVAQVRNACSKVGGAFETHSDGGGYGCKKNNCDGKGGNCEVQCDNNNNCTGNTPQRYQAGASPMDVLTGSTGAASSAGGAPKPGGLLGDGILGGGMGLGTTGPAATGAPGSTGRGSPAAAPIQLR